MLPADHPDQTPYARDPTGFVVQLYKDIKAVYASPYVDTTEDVMKAIEALHSGLKDGYTRKIMLEKAQQVLGITSAEHRAACHKFVRDRFWTKQFRRTTPYTPPTAAKPWEGPMPERP